MSLTERKCCGSFNKEAQPAAPKAPARAAAPIELNENDICPCYRKAAPKM
ncbi:MAG: hypothetical protein ACAH80_03300 [Alphaproteobacteria bacterium]